MSAPFAILCAGFALILLLSAPIAVVIALSSCAAIFASGKEPFEIVATSMAHGTDSFALLAIPFFILSGMIMGRGAMAVRLRDLAAALVSRFPGGLAYVNTVTCMLFGSISGSAVAAVSSIGSFMIPQMEKKGYGKNLSVALTVCSSTTGMLIPPSNIMIVYSVAVGGLSIGALFLAGVVPGIVLGLAIMAASFLYARRRKIKPEGAFDFPLILRAFKRAFLSLLLVFIVLGGILGGVFTATESAVISVAYAFVLEFVVYRDIKISEMWDILAKSAETTGVVMMIIGASTAMSWIMTMSNAPAQIAEALMYFGNSKVALLIIINIILLIVGTFMDMTPAVLIFTPIFLPIAHSLGISDLHFGIIMITNLSIGLCTPPVGTCLFVGCGVGETSMAKVAPSLAGYVAAMVAALMLITFVPELSLWLPRVLGLGV